MPYYKSANLLFIHIPKTGGTNIENNIKQIHTQTLYSGETNTLLPSPYKKISLQHQFIQTIYKHQETLNVDFTNIKMFTVVRNPYARIISDLFWFKLIKPEDNPAVVLNVMLNKYIFDGKLYDNHVEPQYKFISYKGKLIRNIKIFKCEELNNINDELNEFLGFKINIINNNANKDYSKYLNQNSIALINKIYKKDFELFKYPMLPSTFDSNN